MITNAGIAWDDVVVGQTLEPLQFEVTYSTLARDVVGTRDLYRIHHDPPFAQGNGAPNIFLNTMWYQGLIGRYISEWAGYESFLKKLSVKIRSHGCPGDTLTVTATVVGREEIDGRLLVDLDLTIGNDRRADAVVSTARVELV
jgi:acyl dehydratase